MGLMSKILILILLIQINLSLNKNIVSTIILFTYDFIVIEKWASIGQCPTPLDFQDARFFVRQYKFYV